MSEKKNEVLEERLFWMNLNDAGIDEIGYLMTMEQLCKELPDKPATFSFGGIIQGGEWTPEEIGLLLSGSEKNSTVPVLEGGYSAKSTFTVHEVKSMEQLKKLLTWESYDFADGYTAVSFDCDYPDYVPEKYRLSTCVYGDEPGWTSENLPKSGDPNPTVEKYAKELGLGMVSGLRYEYTDEERAAIEISQSVQSADLTLSEFLEILDSYNLEKPTLIASDIEWDIDMDEIYEKMDEIAIDKAAEILGISAVRYGNMTPSEQHDLIYDTIHHNRKSMFMAEELFDLPEEIVLPDELKDTDDITDYISDTYGFCIEGYTLSSEEREHVKEDIDR